MRRRVRAPRDRGLHAPAAGDCAAARQLEVGRKDSVLMSD
jgi:hypothetical protein